MMAIITPGLKGIFAINTQLRGNYTGVSINAISSPGYPYDLAINYPEAKKVTVHYNPNDPGRAVLEPGMVCSSKAFDLFSSFLLITGIYLLGVGVSRLWKRARV